MSAPSSTSDDTSPELSVKSSGTPVEPHNVSRPSSSQEPKAITLSRRGQDNGKAASLLISDDCLASDPSTPRLPPTRNGSNDLHDPSALSISAQPSKYHTARTFSSSVSEPGSQSTEDSHLSQPHTSTISSEQDGNRVQSWLEGSQQSEAVRIAKSPTLPLITRTKPQRSPLHARMSDTWGKEVEGTFNRSAREEAFSEKRHRSSSRSSQSRVEKRIEATLAEAEPASHARSRKSSHTLGLFKETTVPQVNRRKQGEPRTIVEDAFHSSSIGRIKVWNDVTDIEQENQQPVGERQGVNHSTEALSQALKADVDDASAGRITSSISRRLSSLTPESSLGEDWVTLPRNEDLTARGSKHRDQPQSPKARDLSKRSIPPRLLEEIRNFHNLATPIHDKFRSAQFRSTDLSQREGEPKILSRGQGDSISREDADLLLEAKAKFDENEDEESEHISSILYNPHQAPSPDALEDVSIENARKTKDSLIDLETQLPAPALPATDDDENDKDVDIALQVHNKNRYFHGDLSKAQLPQKEIVKPLAPESEFSSASESEYESQDENRPSMVQDYASLTDDAEATPRASPNTRKSFLASRSRKSRRGPIGAVELKPFNHQVGGHTNLFRFSKRAVCKQLSKRENEFYEVVERQHPELLKFLPKYDTLCLWQIRILLCQNYPSSPRL